MFDYRFAGLLYVAVKAWVSDSWPGATGGDVVSCAHR